MNSPAPLPDVRREHVHCPLPPGHDTDAGAVHRRLTDFGPGRSKVFSKSADDDLKVDSVGPAEADVTEGSGGVWERLHYDWSNPNRVVLTTTDSNVWGGSSGYTYTFKQLPNGMTDVDVVIVREGKNAYALGVGPRHGRRVRTPTLGRGARRR